MKRLTLFQILFMLFLIPAMSQPCLAHKVRIFAWEDGGKIMTESKFSKGRPAQNATILVIEVTTGQQLLSGTTDTEGLFSFPLPKINTKELEIIVDAGDGHKNSWQYTLEDSSPVDNSTPPLSKDTTTIQKLPPAPESRLPEVNIQQTLTSAELTRIIETVIDKKLAPIKRTLAENSEQGPSMQDILGGIGYILGLAGIAAYMQSLKNKKE